MIWTITIELIFLIVKNSFDVEVIFQVAGSIKKAISKTELQKFRTFLMGQIFAVSLSFECF